MERYVGLDVHSKLSSFAIQDSSGQLVAQGVVPSTPEGLQRIRDQHALPPGTPVALESGTNAFFVVDVLSDLGLDPRVIDAYEVRVKASRPLQKSDRRDAFELCNGLRRGIYCNIVWVPPRSTRLARYTPTFVARGAPPKPTAFSAATTGLHPRKAEAQGAGARRGTTTTVPSGSWCTLTLTP